MENERLCFSVLSKYTRLLRDWKVCYASVSPEEEPDARFVEACHEPDHMEYMLSDGRLDKLKGIINGRDAE